MSQILYFKRLIKPLILATVLFCSSCSDLLENDNKFFHVSTQEQQWNALTDTRSALFGIYGLMRTALGENNTCWAVGDLRMGDFTVRMRDDLQAIRDNRLDASFDNIRQISNWNRFYKVVNAACVFIENAGKVLEKDKAYSETNYTYDIAQARALRALAYFYMVQMWGDVPLITQSYDNGTFPEVARTDEDVILNYIEGELLEVSQLLPEQLGSSSDKYYEGDTNTWRGLLINRYSVYAILTHVAAWKGNYVDAEAYSGQILDHLPAFIKSTSPYTTTENLVSSKGIFSSKYSSDYSATRLVAFGYSYVSSDNGDVNETGTDGHLESWTLAEPIIRKQLPDIYLSKDTLESLFMNKFTTDSRYGVDESSSPIKYFSNYVTGIHYQYPIFSKMKVVREGEDKTNDLGLFSSFIIWSRFEDILLMHAEALAILNRPDDALADLNAFRSARNLRNLSYAKDLNSSTRNLLKEIFQERRKELMGEGHRWFDRIREARLIGDDQTMTELVNNGGIYWPVAGEVLRENPAITQNEYWKR